MNLIMYTDGACRGNPGISSYAYIIYDDMYNKIIFDAKYIGIATNNIAEYSAVLYGIYRLLQIKFNKVTIYMDSKLVTMQLLGKYKVKDDKLMKYFKQIKKLTYGKNIEYIHIPREKNKEADMLANKVLDNLFL